MSIVYIATNPSFKKGLIKIGWTSFENPEIRMKNLNTTGVPCDFQAVYFIGCIDAREAEKEIKKELEHIHYNKEFFKCSVKKAISVVSKVCNSQYNSMEYLEEYEERKNITSLLKCELPNIREDIISIVIVQTRTVAWLEISQQTKSSTDQFIRKVEISNISNQFNSHQKSIMLPTNSIQENTEFLIEFCRDHKEDFIKYLNEELFWKGDSDFLKTKFIDEWN